VLCIAAIGCESSDEEGGGFETTAPAPRGSGGFSADLAKELDSKGDAKVVAVGDTKGSDAKPEPKDTTSEAKDTKDPKDTKPEAKDSKDTKPEAKDTKDPKPEVKDTRPDPKDTIEMKPGPPPIDTAKPRVAVKPSAEVAAIKLSLSPNWDRDVGEAGTISLVVKVPGTENTRVFAFRYGYEDPKAPTDREAYKKWLAAQGILSPTIDRQRGGTWYLEGTDGSGAPVFRMVATFGGRKLICGGSLYRDAASNQLGDIRDKTLIQAKEICESVSL
jgi:hypothetical protein